MNLQFFPIIVTPIISEKKMTFICNSLQRKSLPTKIIFFLSHHFKNRSLADVPLFAICFWETALLQMFLYLLSVFGKPLSYRCSFIRYLLFGNPFSCKRSFICYLLLGNHSPIDVPLSAICFWETLLLQTFLYSLSVFGKPLSYRFLFFKFFLAVSLNFIINDGI